MGPDQHEQVGKARDLGAEVGEGTVAPAISQALPAGPGELDAIEGAGDGVEAGGVDQ